MIGNLFIILERETDWCTGEIHGLDVDRTTAASETALSWRI